MSLSPSFNDKLSMLSKDEAPQAVKPSTQCSPRRIGYGSRAVPIPFDCQHVVSQYIFIESVSISHGFRVISMVYFVSRQTNTQYRHTETHTSLTPLKNWARFYCRKVCSKEIRSRPCVRTNSAWYLFIIVERYAESADVTLDGAGGGIMRSNVVGL